MKTEFEKLKEVMQKAAAASKIYHESIAEVRRTRKPEHIVRETNELAKLLKDVIEKATVAAMVNIDEMEADIRKQSILDPKAYNKEIMDLVFMLKPDAKELEQIAQQFDGNETMLRAFRKYCDDNTVNAKLPLCGNDKLKLLDTMRQDIKYIFACAGEPTSEMNRYGDEILQHWAANFESVLADKIATLGTD
jgi:bifunctional ADP-heptose synthase (sugar kinase/adenylyltransferase)